MNEYQYHIEVLKQKIECESRGSWRAWKYESLNKKKQPLFKTFFTKLHSGQRTINKRKHLENGLETRTNEKREKLW